MTTPEPWALRGHVSRFAAPRGGGIATADERDSLARHGRAGFLVDLLAWRRSALTLTTLVVVAGAAATSTDFLLRWEHLVAHRSELGVLLDVVLLRLVSPWLVALLCLAALWQWRHLRWSRRLVLAAAAIELLPSFLIAMLPPSWLVPSSDSALGAMGSHALRLALAAGLAMRLVGILSAAFRSAVVVKLLLPESPVPGAMIAALVPINLGFAVAAYVGVNAGVQGWPFAAAFACLVLYQLAYMRRGRSLLRPQDDPEVARAFRPAMRARVVVMPLMGAFMLLFLFTSANSLGKPIIDGAWLAKHWVLLVGIATNYALTLVAGVDLIVAGVVGMTLPSDDVAPAGESDDPRIARIAVLMEKARSVAGA